MRQSRHAGELLTVGEMARRSGVAVSAIHFYEEKELIVGVRDGRNHRLFPRGELRRIAFVKVAQRLGFSLEEIKDAFRAVPADRIPTKADWDKVSRAWRVILDRKIALMNKLRDQLDLCIGCGCLSMSECPLRNPDDKLARKGPGPRLL